MMPQAKPPEQAAPLSRYDALVAAGELEADAGQRAAAQALDALYNSILTPAAPARGLRRWLAPRASVGSGVYLWGAVGRGKSMLMDLFVACLQDSGLARDVRRIHFHAFMLDVHQRLHALRAHHADDTLPALVAHLASEVRILCLDEFMVTDVADAMILARLFTLLLDAGVRVVFTSNRPPRGLYEGGLQRDQFLKFAGLVESHLKVVEVKATQDYRLKMLAAMERTYVYPRDSESDDFLLGTWKQLTGGAPSHSLALSLQGRVLRIDKQVNGTAWLTFGELCMRPLGAADYLTLAKVCHTLLLQGIPQMNSDMRNEARRFITLIDTLYDHRVKLIATAAVAPQELYAEGEGSVDFARTVSRLMEMQSGHYLAQAHIG